MLSLSPISMFLIAQAVTGVPAKPDSTPVLQIGVFCTQPTSECKEPRTKPACHENPFSMSPAARLALGIGRFPTPRLMPGAFQDRYKA